MFPSSSISPLYTDLYQLTMGQAYFQNGKHEVPASFDYFFRKIPYKGGYVILAGLEELLQMIENLKFSLEDIDYLNKKGFHDDFLDYLKTFRFRGNIFGMREGEIVFPFEPILRVEGTLLEGQLVETLLLNILNFQSLIATKASRIRQSAGHRILSDFGLRRAQSFGSMHASRAAIIGGFDNTSNVLAAQRYGIPPSGTMAHSFIETFDSELDAFRNYADSFPDQCVLLVDTYNTLKSGVPNAIKIAHALESQGHKLRAIRLDSGDLAYFAKRARKMLDDSKLEYVKIVVSNQLDEHVIKSLLDQGAPIDIFGVGTSMIIGKPDGAIDGVYKLASAGGKARLKISENVQKTTLPGRKKVFRYLDQDGKFYADCIALIEEEHPQKMIHPFEKEKSLALDGRDFEEIFFTLMEKGKTIDKSHTPFELRERVYKRLERLPEEHQRFDFPHIYKVGITQRLSDLRSQIIQQHHDIL
jgi:nicotinate phosphoribosyltransferase